jgi:uncharacterized membrane protein
MKHKRLALLTQGALIAALYTALTYLINYFGLANGAIQVRISEALTILPVFTPAAIPGLFIGCLLSNLLTGAAIWDIVFGSLASLLGAVFTYLLRKHEKLAALPPILSNTLIIPFVLKWAYGVPDALPYLFLTVGLGELLSCGVLGMILLYALKPRAKMLFPQN